MKALSIRLKVIIVLLVLVFVMISSMGWFIHKSFNQNFIQYRQGIENEFKNKLSNKLEQFYQESNSWNDLEDNRRLWNEMVHTSAIETGDPESLNSPLKKRKPKEKKKNNWSRPRREFRQPLIPPAALYNKEKNLLVSTRGGFKQDKEYIKLTSNGELTGYLVVQSYKKLNHEFDKKFVSRMTKMLWKLGLLMFAFAVFISFPISRYLTRRIEGINRATGQIIKGNFDIKLEKQNHDELGQLASNVKHLAKSLKSTQEHQKSMIADIAHELRTPVSVILSKVEAIQDGIHPPNPETFDLLHGQISSLKNIINDLHELNESDLGSLKYSMQSVNMNQLLIHSFQSYEHKFKAKSIEYNLNLPKQQIEIQADSNRLNQLMNNLLQNSLEYTSSGGKVDIDLKHDSGLLKLVINDSEPGLNREQLQQIFERWYRVDKSRNRNTGGSGLGLAICKKIAKAHGAEIYAESSHLGGIKIIIEWDNT